MKLQQNPFLKKLGHPAIFFYTALWLIALLFAGTLVQKNVGLYEARQLYFSSWFTYLGFLPLPGGRLTMALMTLNLISKFLFATKWSFKFLGINITHSGVLLLLLGGFITAYTSMEGTMLIPEGDKSSFFEDSHRKELVLTNVENDADVFISSKLPEKKNATIKIEPLPLTFTVLKYYRNCHAEVRKQAAQAPLQGGARRFILKPLPSNKEDRNIAGIEFTIDGLEKGQNGTYFLFENMPVDQKITLNDKQYILSLRRKRYAVPFTLELIDFEKEIHPGTETAKSFRSTIKLHDEEIARRIIIEMNEPLRHRGYTFYQSSYIEGEKRDATVLAVVKNAGWLFPYMASITICLGILIQLLLRLPKRISGKKQSLRKSKTPLVSLLFLCIALTIPATLKADENLSVTIEPIKIEQKHWAPLGKIVIQHEGRLKPLDTFARTQLLSYYHRSKVSSQKSALQWLFDLLLQPEKSYQKKHFRIRNPEVLTAIGLEKSTDSLYSFDQLKVALHKNLDTLQKLHAKEKDHRTLVENQLVDLYLRTTQYYQLSRSLTCLTPNFVLKNKNLAQQLTLPHNEPIAYFDFVLKQDLLRQKIEAFTKHLKNPSTDQNKLTQEEKALSGLIHQLNAQIDDHTAKELPLIAPKEKPTQSQWASPWELLDGRPLSEKQKTLLIKLSQTLHILSTSLEKELSKEEQKILIKSIQSFQSSTAYTTKISLETFYNKAKLFTYSLTFYLITFLLLAFSWLFWARLLYPLSLISLAIGWLLHAIGLLIRCLILSRPPVSNLYETFIFVGFIAVTLGLLFEWRQKNGLGILSASIIGVILHFIAQSYAADGDTLGMLVAVLNSNFWLATHVVTITIGYGSTLVAGIMGHVYLIRRLIFPKDQKGRAELFQNMKGLTLIALFFTCLGTILGGIWADQSWGRFWGWDPKENGALLIVLWLLVLIHGQYSKQIGALAYASGLVIANIAVALAWFGVNLLSVGLHSYGFTEGIALNLLIFTLLELAIALILPAFILLKKNPAP